jgi:hypothetical protein
MPIAAIAAPLVTALATKAFEKLGDKTAETVYEKITGLFKPDELTTLDLFKANPEDVKLQGKLEAKLEDRLPQHPAIAAELEALLKALPAATEVKQNTIKQIGNNNFAAQDVKNSVININK